ASSPATNSSSPPTSSPKIPSSTAANSERRDKDGRKAENRESGKSENTNHQPFAGVSSFPDFFFFPAVSRFSDFPLSRFSAVFLSHHICCHGRSTTRSLSRAR